MNNPKMQQRKSIRLKGYDYSQAGLYFITICTQYRECLFGEVKNGEMILNIFGKIALTEWYQTEVVRANCRIHESIVMPNHLHGIIEILYGNGENNEIGKFQSPSQTIGAIIRGFKIATIKKIKDLIQENNNRSVAGFKPNMGELDFAPSTGELQFAPTIKNLDYKIWQRNYYERIIRDEKAYLNISEYIINNPGKWEADTLNK